MPTAVFLEVTAADAQCGYRSIAHYPLPQSIDCASFVRDIGRKVLAKTWSEERFEAMRIEDKDGIIHTYTMYDRAREHFGVVALSIGQLEAFKASAALGMIQ